jgi:hypothetical protein
MPPAGFEPAMPVSGRPQTHPRLRPRAATGMGWYNCAPFICLLGLHRDNCTFAFSYSSFVSFWPVENVEELADGPSGKDGVFVVLHLLVRYRCRCASDSLLAFRLKTSPAKI